MMTLEEKYFDRPKKDKRPEKGRAVKLLKNTPVFFNSDLEDTNMALKAVRSEVIPSGTIVLIWNHQWAGVNIEQDEECTVLWNDGLWATIDAFHKMGLDWEYV